MTEDKGKGRWSGREGASKGRVEGSSPKTLSKRTVRPPSVSVCPTLERTAAPALTPEIP